MPTSRTTTKVKPVKATRTTVTKNATVRRRAPRTPKLAPVQIKPPQRPTKKTSRAISKAALQKSLKNQPKVVTGFLDFLREQSVVGLAIGLVMGTQVKVLADQLIASFVNPMVGLVLPGRGSLDEKTFSIIIEGKTAVFTWGSFVATLLSFVITAAVIYLVFKSLKLDSLTSKKTEKY